jgi:hypothetical protein
MYAPFLGISDTLYLAIFHKPPKVPVFELDYSLYLKVRASAWQKRLK